MRKLHLLCSSILLGVVLVLPVSAQTFKFSSNPHLPVQSSQVTTDHLYVPTNVKMTDVRVALYCKVIYYSSLRIILTAPTGEQVVLRNETNADWYGSWGSERSYTLFQDGGNTDVAPSGKQPNDRPIAPATPFSTLTGKTSMGWWTLRIEDHRYGNYSPYQDGFLENWVVMFNSVTTEPEVPIWSMTRVGASLTGYLNGIENRIPNEWGAFDICTGVNNSDPPVVPGRNGDAYPFEISIPAYPGLLVGDPVPGYAAPGRFRVTVNVATNYPNSGAPPAANTDIAVYFGKVPVFNPPLGSAPAPDSSKVAKEWPAGSGGTTPSLLGPSPLFGGVRLSACNANDGWSPALSFGVGGYLDVVFDDLAINPIEGADECNPGGGDLCGTFRPETPFSSLNGETVDGLYYVTVYDTFGDNTFTWYGHVRVLSVKVEYLAGGGETPNPNYHEGIAGPLMGVPIPGGITGAPFGYLADVVGAIPPQGVHAKDQDPILVIWATQKLGPRTATGYERLEAIDNNNYAPAGGIRYDGPYAYPGSLDADPLVAGAQAQADLIEVPVGMYTLRTNLMQARYDDDVSNNEYNSYPFRVTQSRMSYYGDQNVFWTGFQHGNNIGFYAQFYVAPAGQNTSSNGSTFALFKYPYTTVTSVDFRFDNGYVNLGTPSPQYQARITVWRCSGGFSGAPVGPPVAMSKIINGNEEMPGNWRSFPLYQVDQQGQITTNPSVNLAPGVYAVQIENVDAIAALMYPYSYKVLPFIKDRYVDFHFSERFGPIAPFSQLGTHLQYTGTAGGSAPTGVLSAVVNPSGFSNFCWPLQVNMTDLNDFAIDYIAINGIGGTETVSLTNAPFQPNIMVTANSLQGGLTKTFNVRLEIFDGGTRVYLSDKMFSINPYETVSCAMDQWNPAVGGVYHIKASFSRNPDDQNPLNDMHEYDLYVSPTRAILIAGSDAGTVEVNNAETALRSKGLDVQTVRASDLNVPVERGTTMYLVGNVDGHAKDVVQASIAAGADVAIVDRNDEKVGTFLRKYDRLFDIDRGLVNYDDIDMIPVRTNDAPVAKDPKAPALNFKSKSEMLDYLKSAPTSGIESVDDGIRVDHDAEARAFQHMIPVETSSPYGRVNTIHEAVGQTGITYLLPENRKPVRMQVAQTTPAGFDLEQNYPNPFNPTTNIRYTLPEESVIALRITDMLGREVLTLVNETAKAGTYNVNWKGVDQSGHDVASGQYLYRFEATPVNGGTTFTSVRKMMLAK